MNTTNTIQQNQFEKLPNPQTENLTKMITEISSSHNSYLDLMKGILNQPQHSTPPIQKEVTNKKSLKPMKKTTTPKKINSEFDKLKNPLLREKLQSSQVVKYNPKKHIRTSETDYPSIYDLGKLSKKNWEQYFSKSKVYIDSDRTSLKSISKKILFDKEILNHFKKQTDKKQLNNINTDINNGWRDVFSKPHIKRDYVRGGKYGKIKGFDFYLNSNERLKPYQRRNLISEGNIIIDDCIQKLSVLNGNSTDLLIQNTSLNNLDSKLSDEELLGMWNLQYDDYGYLMDRFFDKWSMERLVGSTMENQIENSLDSDQILIDDSKLKSLVDRFRTSHSSLPF